MARTRPEEENSGAGGGDEKDQARQHTAPPALVIHGIVRAEGEAELARAAPAIGCSGLAAGLSMGFSFLSLALVQSALPDMPSLFGHCAQTGRKGMARA